TDSLVDGGQGNASDLNLTIQRMIDGACTGDREISAEFRLAPHRDAILAAGIEARHCERLGRWRLRGYWCTCKEENCSGNEPTYLGHLGRNESTILVTATRSEATFKPIGSARASLVARTYFCGGQTAIWFSRESFESPPQFQACRQQSSKTF